MLEADGGVLGIHEVLVEGHVRPVHPFVDPDPERADERILVFEYVGDEPGVIAGVDNFVIFDVLPAAPQGHGRDRQAAVGRGTAHGLADHRLPCA